MKFMEIHMEVLSFIDLSQIGQHLEQDHREHLFAYL
jgi:hypothetical protein